MNKFRCMKASWQERIFHIADPFYGEYSGYYHEVVCVAAWEAQNHLFKKKGHFEGIVQERRNPSALAMALCLFGIMPVAYIFHVNFRPLWWIVSLRSGFSMNTEYLVALTKLLRNHIYSVGWPTIPVRIVEPQGRRAIMWLYNVYYICLYV